MLNRSENNPDIITIPAGVDTSLGHDKYEFIFRELLHGFGIRPFREYIKPQNGSNNIISNFLWKRGEQGRKDLAHENDNQSLKSNLLGFIGKTIRNLSFVNQGLIYDLQNKLSEINPKTILTSHYLALIAAPPETQKIFIVPDLLTHDVVNDVLANDPNIICLCPTEDSQKKLNSNLGKDKSNNENVLLTGTVVTREMFESINKRQAQLNQISVLPNGQIQPKALFAIGGSAAEADEVFDACCHLQREGFEIEVIVENNSERTAQLIRNLERINKLHQDSPQIDLKVFERGNREEHMQAYADALSDPTITHCFTRPNETMIYAMSLGMQVVSLQPYQEHEKESLKIVREGSKKNGQILTYAEFVNQEGVVVGSFKDALDKRYIKAMNPNDLLKNKKLFKALRIKNDTN